MYLYYTLWKTDNKTACGAKHIYVLPSKRPITKTPFVVLVKTDYTSNFPVSYNVNTEHTI